jgi:hypothetical protein
LMVAISRGLLPGSRRQSKPSNSTRVPETSHRGELGLFHQGQRRTRLQPVVAKDLLPTRICNAQDMEIVRIHFRGKPKEASLEIVLGRRSIRKELPMPRRKLYVPPSKVTVEGGVFAQ